MNFCKSSFSSSLVITDFLRLLEGEGDRLSDGEIERRLFPFSLLVAPFSFVMIYVNDNTIKESLNNYLYGLS